MAGASCSLGTGQGVGTTSTSSQNLDADHVKQKEIGKLSLAGFSNGLEGLTLKPFLKGLDWSFEKLQVFLMEVRDELKRWNDLKAVCHLLSVSKCPQNIFRY